MTLQLWCRQWQGIIEALSESMNDDWNGDDDGHVDSSQCGLVCDNHPDR